MAIPRAPTDTAVRADDFQNTLGVNTHIDFAAYGYENLATVAASINYLGVKNLRDSAQSPDDAVTWLQVARATGAKFDDYIAETSPAGMVAGLGYAATLAAEGILNFIEGGNEEDDPYAAALGNTLAITARFQQQVHATGLALGLPVINMSFGAGWTAANDYQGNYASVGDLAAWADYANAHTYPNVGQGTDWSMRRLDGLAGLADGADPVITTEIGWNESQGFGQANIARYVLQAALDGMRDGGVKTYFYGLFDDGSGLFGLMNQDGTAKPAGTALHNLTTLLADPGETAASFIPGTLNHTLSDTTSGDNALLLEKSDGSFWMPLWNEDAAPHAVTLTLDAAATEIRVFDPLTGTTAVRDATGVSSMTVTVSDSPIILEIIGASTATAGTETPAPDVTSAPAVTPGDDVTPTPSPTLAPTPDDLTIEAPESATVATGATLGLSGVSISDVWAAGNPGTMTLNLWDSGGGTISIAGHAARSSDGISLSGTLAELNADLAGLSYASGVAGGDSITLDVWNQAGVRAQTTIAMTVIPAAVMTSAETAPVASATPAGAPSPTPAVPEITPPSTAAAPDVAARVAAIVIAANDARTVVPESHVSITATAGDHMLFIGGTDSVAMLTGGNETVQAFEGHNAIVTGAGADTISIAGSFNVVNAGAGGNIINDSGDHNRIVMPTAGTGRVNVYGSVLDNGDTFDFSAALRATAWDGTTATVGQFLHVTISGNDTIVSISTLPSTTGTKIADFHDSGALSLAGLLAHATL